MLIIVIDIGVNQYVLRMLGLVLVKHLTLDVQQHEQGIVSN